MRNLLGFTTTNKLETHSVGSVTGVITSLATISSSFSLMWFLKALLGVCTTGGTTSSMIM